MVKFVAFEHVVNMLYTNVVPKPKSECSKNEQLGVSFAAGYIAGMHHCSCTSLLYAWHISQLSSRTAWHCAHTAV